MTLLDGNFAREFALAGDATFTVENPQTGGRFTFNVIAPRKAGGGKDLRADVRFVKVLTGANNENDYQFLGTIFVRDGQYRHSGKSRIGPDAKSAQAFAWLWPLMFIGAGWSPVEIHHQGRCGRCGRSLTVPSSVRSGLGPICAVRAA